MRSIRYLFIVTCFFSCLQKNNSVDNTTTDSNPIKIIVQPFSDIPKNQVTYVYNELRKIYPNCIIYSPLKLPHTAYYKERNRYRADSLIQYLYSNTPDGCVTIGLTSKDISHTKGKIKDYGIMGLGYQPGSSCVVSTFRLSKDSVLDQLFKLSIHELGHTQGLPHCLANTCFMRDAEGKNHINEESSFCEKCSKHLTAKGWIFKK